MTAPASTPGWFYLLALAVTLPLWMRLVRRDRSLLLLYVAALLGAMIGGKICYVSVEGWADWPHSDRWMRLLTGKSILGALFFGFLAVEGVKRLQGIQRVTGDFFAVVVPLGIAVGRVGCIRNGCCRGLDGWPAPYVELGFNLACALLVLLARRSGWGRGQLFHGYLIAYGLFRFAHEFLRDTPRSVGGVLSGYQLWALALAALGAWAFAKRRRALRVEQS